MIFVNQEFGLESTITENGSAVDLTGGSVAFDYWLPGNATTFPDGEVAGVIVSATDGTVTATITEEINNTVGKYFRSQAKATVGGKPYPAPATCSEIYPRGAGCS